MFHKARKQKREASHGQRLFHKPRNREVWAVFTQLEVGFSSIYSWGLPQVCTLPLGLSSRKRPNTSEVTFWLINMATSAD